MSVTPGGTVWMVKMKRIVVRKTWGKVYKFLFKWQSFYYLDWYYNIPLLVKFSHHTSPPFICLLFIFNFGKIAIYDSHLNTE